MSEAINHQPVPNTPEDSGLMIETHPFDDHERFAVYTHEDKDGKRTSDLILLTAEHEIINDSDPTASVDARFYTGKTSTGRIVDAPASQVELLPDTSDDGDVEYPHAFSGVLSRMDKTGNPTNEAAHVVGESIVNGERSYRLITRNGKELTVPTDQFEFKQVELPTGVDGRQPAQIVSEAGKTERPNALKSSMELAEERTKDGPQTVRTASRSEAVEPGAAQDWFENRMPEDYTGSAELKNGRQVTVQGMTGEIGGIRYFQTNQGVYAENRLQNFVAQQAAKAPAAPDNPPRTIPDRPVTQPGPSSAETAEEQEIDDEEQEGDTKQENAPIHKVSTAHPRSAAGRPIDLEKEGPSPEDTRRFNGGGEPYMPEMEPEPEAKRYFDVGSAELHESETFASAETDAHLVFMGVFDADDAKERKDAAQDLKNFYFFKNRHEANVEADKRQMPEQSMEMALNTLRNDHPDLQSTSVAVDQLMEDGSKRVVYGHFGGAKAYIVREVDGKPTAIDVDYGKEKPEEKTDLRIGTVDLQPGERLILSKRPLPLHEYAHLMMPADKEGQERGVRQTATDLKQTSKSPVMVIDVSSAGAEAASERSDGKERDGSEISRRRIRRLGAGVLAGVEMFSFRTARAVNELPPLRVAKTVRKRRQDNKAA